MRDRLPFYCHASLHRSSASTLCTTLNVMGVSGETVDTPARCAFLAHYEPDDKEPDPRVAGELAIAVVVGIGMYQNSSYKILDADVDELQSFLIYEQAFDELILLKDHQATIALAAAPEAHRIPDRLKTHYTTPLPAVRRAE
jgi:hypothetical protein